MQTMNNPNEFESLSLRSSSALNISELSEHKKEVRQVVRQNDSSIVFMVEEPNKQYLESMIKKVRINDCGRNVSKRWYVDYISINPNTGKPVRKRAYGYINKEKDPDKRYELLLQLKYEIEAEITSAIIGDKIDNDAALTPTNSMKYFIQAFLKAKKKVLRKNSTRTYQTTMRELQKFLSKKNLLLKHPALVKRDTINEFKYHYENKVGNRTINNQLNTVRTLFNFIMDEYDNVLIKNPCKGVPKLNSRSEKNVAYTTEQLTKIGAYLREHDPYLHHFIMFIGMGFLRPGDILNLKVKDIDFTQNTITVSAGNTKTARRMNKKMLSAFSDYIKAIGLQNADPEFYVFGNKCKPGPKKCHDLFFRRRFRKVKVKFNLSRLHTLYGFRHTFISNLLDNKANAHEIMKYTGHEDMKAFQAYARSVLDKPAEDLSSFITLNF